MAWPRQGLRSCHLAKATQQLVVEPGWPLGVCLSRFLPSVQLMGFNALFCCEASVSGFYPERTLNAA